MAHRVDYDNVDRKRAYKEGEKLGKYIERKYAKENIDQIGSIINNALAYMGLALD